MGGPEGFLALNEGPDLDPDFDAGPLFLGPPLEGPPLFGLVGAIVNFSLYLFSGCRGQQKKRKVACIYYQKTRSCSRNNFSRSAELRARVQSAKAGARTGTRAQPDDTPVLQASSYTGAATSSHCAHPPPHQLPWTQVKPQHTQTCPANDSSVFQSRNG